MADWVVLYNHDDGKVVAMWPRTTSDNVSTWVADGKLTVDGVDVAEGFQDADVTADIRAVVKADPTDADADAPPGVLEVETTGDTVDDVDERTDDGRNPDYDYSDGG